ncbi:hypothetical protein ACFOJ6_08665 [Gordonia humi]
MRGSPAPPNSFSARGDQTGDLVLGRRAPSAQTALDGCFGL